MFKELNEVCFGSKQPSIKDRVMYMESLVTDLLHEIDDIKKELENDIRTR